MTIKLNLQGIKDNLQHVAGSIIGLAILKPLGLRYNKEDRGMYWFSAVAANNAAEGIIQWLPYVMIYKTK